MITVIYLNGMLFAWWFRVNGSFPSNFLGVICLKLGYFGFGPFIVICFGCFHLLKLSDPYGKKHDGRCFDKSCSRRFSRADNLRGRDQRIFQKVVVWYGEGDNGPFVSSV